MTGKEFSKLLDEMSRESGFDFHIVQKAWAYHAAKAYHKQEVEAKDKLIDWLDKECTHGSMTHDLAYGFAELLRIKLDKLLKQ